MSYSLGSQEAAVSTSGELSSAEPGAQNHTQARLSSWEQVRSTSPQQKPSLSEEGVSLCHLRRGPAGLRRQQLHKRVKTEELQRLPEQPLLGHPHASTLSPPNRFNDPKPFRHIDDSETKFVLRTDPSVP